MGGYICIVIIDGKYGWVSDLNRWKLVRINEFSRRPKQAKMKGKK